jgi:serine/threonine-protein kinase
MEPERSFQCDDARETAPLDGDPAAPAPGPELRTGDVVDGKYRLGVVLGTGGMGIVFEAAHLVLGETVAIKVLSPAGAYNGERLRREARIGLRITTEHVARPMDVGTLPTGAPYVVMERLVGQDLGQVLRQEGRLPIADAVDYVLQACVAIAEAHALGVVHRDLKPSNLFLTRRADGTPLVKVLDFGIAKTRALTNEAGVPLESLTLSTSILGSPKYMAPEQVRGAREADPRVDVWALAVILHELVAGEPPFSGNGPASVLAAIAADPPPRLGSVAPSVPSALEAAILRCLEKDPARRTPNVYAFARAIAPFGPPRSREAVERIAGIRRTHGSDDEGGDEGAVRARWKGRAAVMVGLALGVGGVAALALASRRASTSEPVSMHATAEQAPPARPAEAPTATPSMAPPASEATAPAPTAVATSPSATPPKAAPNTTAPRRRVDARPAAARKEGDDVEAATAERH